MKQKRTPLPDLDPDDNDYRRKLDPLVEAVVPGNRITGVTDVSAASAGGKSIQPHSQSGHPDEGSPAAGQRSSASFQHVVDRRWSATPDNRTSGAQERRPSTMLEAARRHVDIETKRGAKRRFEYLIPERVGIALANDAAGRGISANTRLLEILRDAGYPVIPEDLIDRRKLPRT